MSTQSEQVKEIPQPYSIDNICYRYDCFDNGEILFGKKKGRLPAMGWNSWNAFGTNNNEELTRAMADAIVDLGLDKLGYRYVVLDDGCYKPERVDGRLAFEPARFPSGFNAISDYIHGKGLLFGMYNDVGTNLCGGAEVGTFGHEAEDAADYIAWGIDYLKVDNCYYMWDDATFSDKERVKYVFAPNIRSIRLENANTRICKNAVADGILVGEGAVKLEDKDCVTHIGTFDGTGPDRTPVGVQSSELVFEVESEEPVLYELFIEYASGKEVGVGEWIQVIAGESNDTKVVYDALVEATPDTETYRFSGPMQIFLNRGVNTIRIMNHRRQENTLCSYAAVLEQLKKAAPQKDILLSLCEWGKNQPQNWGYKVGDSWRILNDITFCVGSDGDWGKATWYDDYTPSITSQYNKAVIMDEFAGLDRGWNDPDMLVIGMNGVTEQMNQTHMTMWCMMNSPLMLGMDLRRVKKGDEIYNIIANTDLIALNQDALGIQAKRVVCRVEKEAGNYEYIENPDKAYIRDRIRVDILAKPLADGAVAVAFINIGDRDCTEKISVSMSQIVDAIGAKMVNASEWLSADSYEVKDLWTGQETVLTAKELVVDSLNACGNITLKLSAK